MSEAGKPEGLTKDHLYVIGNSPSLRWSGIKGKQVFVEVATYDGPLLTIVGSKRGKMEIPVADITRLRAGVELWKTNYYRCLVSRKGGRTISLEGTRAGLDYSDLVIHLAEEMEMLGHFDRVERGLRHVAALGHLLLFGGISLVLCYAIYDTWVRWGSDWNGDDWLVPGGVAAASLFLAALALSNYVRWHFPRRVKDIEDLKRVLPYA